MPTSDNNIPHLPSPCKDDASQSLSDTHPNKFTDNDKLPISPGDLVPVQESHIHPSDLTRNLDVPCIPSPPKSLSFTEDNNMASANELTRAVTRKSTSYVNKCIPAQKSFFLLSPDDPPYNEIYNDIYLNRKITSAPRKDMPTYQFFWHTSSLSINIDESSLQSCIIRDDKELVAALKQVHFEF
jgi:hypothetical protein